MNLFTYYLWSDKYKKEWSRKLLLILYYEIRLYVNAAQTILSAEVLRLNVGELLFWFGLVNLNIIQLYNSSIQFFSLSGKFEEKERGL